MEFYRRPQCLVLEHTSLITVSNRKIENTLEHHKFVGILDSLHTSCIPSKTLFRNYVNVCLPSGSRGKELAQLHCQTFSCYWTFLLLPYKFRLQCYTVHKVVYINCFKPKAWSPLTLPCTAAS